MTSDSGSRRGSPLADTVREKLRRHVARVGLKPAAAGLGVSENTITRALAQLGVQSGTALLIEQRLKEVR